jgi:DNA-binding transcriptional MerR regulator
MKKSNDSFFSISDFARITNVTPETLRHYHRIGLLSPSYTDPETNYRYYSMMEFECIGVIQALQSLGISLNEIKQYLKLKNVSYSFALLSEQYINVCNQLDSLSLTKKYLKEKIDTMNMLINQSTLNKIIIKKIHKRYG